MSDALTLTGQLTITPNSTADATLSGDFAIKIPLSATLTLSYKETETLPLLVTVDGAVQYRTVNLDAITSVDFLMIRSDVSSVARITSTAGSTQLIAFDTFLMLFTDAQPITALAIGSAIATAGTARVTMGRV